MYNNSVTYNTNCTNDNRFSSAECTHELSIDFLEGIDNFKLLPAFLYTLKILNFREMGKSRLPFIIARNLRKI